MKRLKAFVIATALGLTVAAADAAPQDQLAVQVARELPLLGFDTDVSTLTRGQLAAIHQIAFGNQSESEKRLRIGSIIGGRHSLLGLLFK